MSACISCLASRYALDLPIRRRSASSRTVSSFARASGLMRCRRGKRHATQPARQRLEARCRLHDLDFLGGEPDPDDADRQIRAASWTTDPILRHEARVGLPLYESNRAWS